MIESALYDKQETVSLYIFNMHLHVIRFIFSAHVSHVVLPATSIFLHVDVPGLLYAVRAKPVSQTSLPVSIINGTSLLPNLSSLSLNKRNVTVGMLEIEFLHVHIMQLLTMFLVV